MCVVAQLPALESFVAPTINLLDHENPSHLATEVSMTPFTAFFLKEAVFL